MRTRVGSNSTMDTDIVQRACALHIRPVIINVRPPAGRVANEVTQLNHLIARTTYEDITCL